MAKTNTIRGKVALVRPPYEIAINRGSEHGVTTGDVVSVFDEWSVKDPDSGEEIGAYRSVRLRFKVNVVTEKSSLAHSFELFGVNRPTILSFAGLYQTAPQTKLITDKPLEADKDTHLVRIGEAVEIEISQQSDSS